METIVLTGNEGDKIEFYVLEMTTLGGVDYMLVTDSEDEDGEAYVLKDLSKTQDTEGVYEIVDDETELEAVGQVFKSLLDDIDIVE